MNPTRLAALKKRLRQTDGVIDLASIMVGVIIVGILSTGIVATTFALIPFTQDASAKQAIDSVRTAEGAAYVSEHPNRYLAMDALVAGEWIQASNKMAVETDVDGTCFVALSHSATGNQFWTDNSNPDVDPYVAGTSTSDCADLATMSTALLTANPEAAAPDGAEPVADIAPNSGAVTTLAGSSSGWADGTGTSAKFKAPRGLDSDSAGTLYVADTEYNFIRKITPEGVVTTIAGNNAGGASGSTDGPAADARFNTPKDIAVHSDGTVYIADSNNNKIRKLSPDGIVSTLAGSGTPGFADGTGASAVLMYPSGVAVDSAGTVYVADTYSNRIRKITPEGVVTTLAGDGTAGSADGQGTAAQFNKPTGIAVDSSGAIYVADSDNDLIRKITPGGMVSTLAGSGTPGAADGQGASAQFNEPTSVDVNSAGTVYVSDRIGNLIRAITPGGMVSTLAGSGTLGFANGSGTSAMFHAPSGVAVDASGIVYVADSGNNRIRKIQ